MLKKLLKYDLEKIIKGLSVFYIIGLATALLARLFMMIDGGFALIMYHVMGGTTISMVVNVVVNNVIRLWVRFKENFYGDESYLFHTLPLSKRTLYSSKLLSAIISLSTSVLVSAAAIFLAYYTPENMEALLSTIQNAGDALGAPVWTIIILSVCVILVQVIVLVLVGYTGIIVGHRANSAKVGKSFLWGAVAYVAAQVLMLAVMGITAIFNEDVMTSFTSPTIPVNAIILLLSEGLIVYALSAVAMVFVDEAVFGKGVNVE